MKQQYHSITPGKPWYDTEGKRIHFMCFQISLCRGFVHCYGGQVASREVY